MRYFGFNEPSFNVKRFGFAFSRFAPTELFANGEQGVWLDPSDLSTMFQDVDGTEPVTKDGDPVALIRDKSGSGNHATQTTASARPIYRTDDDLHWLEFDGVDDNFTTSGSIFRGSKAGYVVVAFKVGSIVGTQVILDYTISAGVSRDLIAIYLSGSKVFVGGRRLPTDNLESIEVGSVNVGDLVVVGAYFDWQSGVLSYSFNGVNSSIAFQTAGITDNVMRGARIGGKDNLPDQNFNGSIYSIVALDAEVSIADRNKVTDYLVTKAGATL